MIFASLFFGLGFFRIRPGSPPRAFPPPSRDQGEASEMALAVPLVKNLLLLDAEGKRIAVKYYGDTWCEHS